MDGCVSPRTRSIGIEKRSQASNVPCQDRGLRTSAKRPRGGGQNPFTVRSDREQTVRSTSIINHTGQITKSERLDQTQAIVISCFIVLHVTFHGRLLYIVASLLILCLSVGLRSVTVNVSFCVAVAVVILLVMTTLTDLSGLLICLLL